MVTLRMFSRGLDTEEFLWHTIALCTVTSSSMYCLPGDGRLNGSHCAVSQNVL